MLKWGKDIIHHFKTDGILPLFQVNSNFFWDNQILNAPIWMYLNEVCIYLNEIYSLHSKR